MSAYIHSNDASTSEILNKYSSALQTLSYCSKTPVNETSPEGCTIITVSDKCEVHLLLKGLIDPAKEIQKIQKKLEFLQSTQKKLEQAMAVPDYSTKVIYWLIWCCIMQDDLSLMFMENRNFVILYCFFCAIDLKHCTHIE